MELTFDSYMFYFKNMNL